MNGALWLIVQQQLEQHAHGEQGGVAGVGGSTGAQALSRLVGIWSRGETLAYQPEQRDVETNGQSEIREQRERLLHANKWDLPSGKNHQVHCTDEFIPRPVDAFEREEDQSGDGSPQTPETGDQRNRGPTSGWTSGWTSVQTVSFFEWPASPELEPGIGIDLLRGSTWTDGQQRAGLDAKGSEHPRPKGDACE